MLRKSTIQQEYGTLDVFEFSHQLTIPCKVCLSIITSVKKDKPNSSTEYKINKHSTSIVYNPIEAGESTIISDSEIKVFKSDNHSPNKKKKKTTKKDIRFFLETLTEVSITSLETLSSEISERQVVEVVDPVFNGTSAEFEYGKFQIPTVKPIVFILNNTGKKLRKLNETVLGNILIKTLGRTIEEVNLEYIDLQKLSEKKRTEGEEPQTNISNVSATTKCSDISRKILPGFNNKPCYQSDFSSNKQCLCDVDSYVNVMKTGLRNIVINEYGCIDFINLQQGIIIGNNTEPLNRKKRSLLYLSYNKFQTNFIETHIKNIFNEDYELNQTDSKILALLSTTIKIPCHNEADFFLKSKGVEYSWEFTRYATEKGEPLPGGSNSFPIHKLEVKDAGNYSCTKLFSSGTRETYSHELEIITFPIYKIKFDIYYAIKKSCSLSDGDILYSYLPKLFSVFLCGQSSKSCSVNINRPICFSSDNESFLNVTVTAKMNSITKILSEDIADCDINCEIRAYANLVSLVHKNAEIIQRVPVFSRLGPEIDFLTNTTNEKNRSPSPKIIITCKSGFGVEKFRQRVCVLCPQDTFSGDDEAFCKFCPTGQYQPIIGSISCLVCSSPVDDVKCLRMLYSDTKLFKLYIGVGFGMVLLLLMVILYWKNSGSSSAYKKISAYNTLQKQRALRRPRDIERGVLEPLMKGKTPVVESYRPPKIPSPDF